MVLWNNTLKPRVRRRIRKLPNPHAKVSALAEIWSVLQSNKIHIFH